MARLRGRGSKLGIADVQQERFLLASYDIELDESGCLKKSRMLKEGESGNNVWHAYVEPEPMGNLWYNGQTYVDTLSKDALTCFIDLSHEVYKGKVGDRFGGVIPAIFCDEPQTTPKSKLPNPRASANVFFPWTLDLPKTFKQEYSTDLVESLPEIVWNLPNGMASVTRYRYHDHVCERFVSAFMDQIGDWCGKNGIMLTGHMMEEPTLRQQTTSLGEAMRCYRNMQMPGMDLLVDWVEYNTAKQAVSVSRQNGAPGTMCEIYGVTHWHFTFEGHKGCGDWQAALGITFRVHHLAWVSMAGEGKRDYPASINYQSPWYKEYGYVEDHFARVGVAMTRGHAVTRVGVIHPIESYWLCFGPDGSSDEPDRRDQAFSDLTNWLLHGLVDFDFISESLLPKQVARQRPGNKKLTVGKCNYDVIVVPNLRTIRSTTLEILQEFTKNYGNVIIAGSAPELVDASVPKRTPSIDNSKNIFWSKETVLGAVEEYRDLRVTTGGRLADRLLYQMRQDGDERFVFICNTDRKSPFATSVQLKGLWKVRMLDTLTGEEKLVRASHKKKWTVFPYRFEGCASLLLRLLPYSNSGDSCRSISYVPDPIVYHEDSEASSSITLEGIELSEPNALLLDYAEYRIDDGSWSSSTEEVLRIDNIIRQRLGLPLKGEAWKQPWAVLPSERAPKAFVSLRFSFESSFTIPKPTKLALEDAATSIIRVNDALLVASADRGPDNWWVDESITTIDIPANCIKKGKNTVTVAFLFGLLTNVERIYLLGDFGVSVNGHQTLLEPFDITKVTWGDIVNQGLPFYVGNVIYNCSFTLPPKSDPGSQVALSVPQFSSPVLAVTDTKTKRKIGRIAFEPHMLSLGSLEAGNHKITITAFGNRYNSFGHLHLPDWVGGWTCGPAFWRTSGGWWTDEYVLRPIGVLECPKVLAGEKALEVRIKDDWEVVETVVD
jgi:hypothetical protein